MVNRTTLTVPKLVRGTASTVLSRCVKTAPMIADAILAGDAHRSLASLETEPAPLPISVGGPELPSTRSFRLDGLRALHMRVAMELEARGLPMDEAFDRTAKPFQGVEWGGLGTLLDTNRCRSVPTLFFAHALACARSEAYDGLEFDFDGLGMPGASSYIEVVWFYFRDTLRTWGGPEPLRDRDQIVETLCRSRDASRMEIEAALHRSAEGWKKYDPDLPTGSQLAEILNRASDSLIDTSRLGDIGAVRDLLWKMESGSS